WVAVFEKVQDLDFAFHLSKSTGSLISRFKRGCLAVFSFFRSVKIDMAGSLGQFVVLAIFLARLDLVYLALISVTFLLNLSLAVVMIKRNISARHAFNTAEDEISAIIVDNMINYDTVKLFANEDYELKRLQTTFQEWMRKLWGYANSFRT